MLAMVSMRSPCKPEIEHGVVLQKKKRKLSKVSMMVLFACCLSNQHHSDLKILQFGFVPSRSTGVISEWKDEDRSFSASKEVDPSRDDRKRAREVSWEQPPPNAMSPAIKLTPVMETVEAKSEPSPKNSSSSESDSSCSSASSDESDTDEEEIMMWAHKMFGCPLRPPSSRQEEEEQQQQQQHTSDHAKSHGLGPMHMPPPPQTTMPQFQSNADAEARARRKKAKKERRRALEDPHDDPYDEGRIGEPERLIARKKKKKQPFVLPPIEECEKFDPEQEQLNMEEERKKRELAKPLTMKQIKEILGEDDFREPCQGNWVRRSVRRPCKSLLNSKPVRSLVRRLKASHREMVVLKMKKYINDPAAPHVVLDASLDALEENKNCEVLFIQVRDIFVAFDAEALHAMLTFKYFLRTSTRE
jgi:hypothetical protein